MFVFSKLLKPLKYAQINHNEKKWFDVFLPCVFALGFILVIKQLPAPITITGKDSLVSLVNGMLQILSGFYIASLAAVATFQKEGMDEPMEGIPPTLNGVALTRRNFLSYLFGYLAFVSICLYFTGGFVNLIQPNVPNMLGGLVNKFSSFFLFIYLVLAFNVFFTTVLGMHFLIDKIHETKPQLNDNNLENENSTGNN